MDWGALMSNKVFISDLGTEQEVMVNDEAVTLGRYAVWSPVSGSGNHCVVEVGGDLAALCAKYGVPDDRIGTLVTDRGVQ